jgi:branched-subunit amino acid aminotransferase/4-amino-4-deoxychorismate lyase
VRLLTRLSKEVRGVGPLRVRLTVDEHGLIEIMSSAISTPISWRYVISDKVLDSGDELLRYKTTWREMYDSEREFAAAAFDCDEVIFFNERSELCEGSRSNIFLSKGGVLLTQAARSGLLDGCLRRELLAAGTCQEAVLTEADLVEADDIYFGNSVHGLIPAKLATSRQAA